MRLALVLGMVIGPALPVAAEPSTARPQGCERIATAQFDNCSVTNLFRCPDSTVAFWIETIDADGVMTIETRNPDHGTLSVIYVGQGVSMRMTQTAAHPRDTLRTGAAEDSLTGEMEMFGMTRAISGRTSYAHAGETTELAGETFARIAFTGTVELPPPMPETSGGGTFLYHEGRDLLIEERVSFDLGGIGETYSLAHLSLPGQARFGDKTPGYGCGEMSRLGGPEAEAAL